MNISKTLLAMVIVPLSLAITAVYPYCLQNHYLGDNWKLSKVTQANINNAKAHRLQYHWERTLFPDDDTSHLGANKGGKINYRWLVSTYRDTLTKLPCTREVILRKGTLIARKGSTKFDVTERGIRNIVRIYNPITGSPTNIPYAVTNSYICAVIR